MHMMRKTGLSSEEMGTVKRSRTPTVVLTANGEVHTHEGAHVFVHDLNHVVAIWLKTVFALSESELVLSVFAMVSHGVDTVPLCRHASQCLFRHPVDDACVKPPMTRTEEEIGA